MAIQDDLTKYGINLSKLSNGSIMASLGGVSHAIDPNSLQGSGIDLNSLPVNDNFGTGGSPLGLNDLLRQGQQTYDWNRERAASDATNNTFGPNHLTQAQYQAQQASQPVDPRNKLPTESTEQWMARTGIKGPTQGSSPTSMTPSNPATTTAPPSAMPSSQSPITAPGNPATQNQAGTSDQSARIAMIKQINPNATDAQIQQILAAFPNGGGTNGTNVSNVTTGTNASSSGINIGGINYDTGNADTNAALKAIYDSGKTTVSQGYQLNPNLTLDPSTINQFLTAATNSVHPYYAQQIKGIQDQLGRDTGQAQAGYENNLANEQQSFKSNLGNAREQYAGNGLAFSGQRGQGETNMQNSENRTLNYNALQYGNQIGDLARNAEKQIGASNMSGFQLPTTPSYSASLSGDKGGFNTNGNTSSSYSSGGYNVGSLTSAEQSDIANRQNSLINSAYGRMSSGLSYQDLLK